MLVNISKKQNEASNCVTECRPYSSSNFYAHKFIILRTIFFKYNPR